MIEINEIQTRRKALGMTQEDLAEAAGISVSLIRKLEQGERDNPTLDTIRKIDAALAAAPKLDDKAA